MEVCQWRLISIWGRQGWPALPCKAEGGEKLNLQATPEEWKGVVQTGIYRERHTDIIKCRGTGIMKGLSQGLLDYRSCRGSQRVGKSQRRSYTYLVLLSSAQNKALPFGSHHQFKKHNQTKMLDQGDYFPK